MILHEREFKAPLVKGQEDLVSYFAGQVQSRLAEGDVPIRFAVTATTDTEYKYEIGIATGRMDSQLARPQSMFQFSRRKVENTE